jgi:signal transduction histidine kinase
VRIVARTRLGAALVVLTTVLIVIALLVGFARVREAVDRNDAVASVLNDAFQLSMLTTDYLSYYEPRAERQWRAKHAAMLGRLALLPLVSKEDAALLESVSADQAEALKLFDALVQARVTAAGGDVDPVIAQEYEIRLTSRLLVTLQSVVSDAFNLAARSSEDVARALREMLTAVFAISILGVAAVVVNGLAAERAIVSPLGTLQTGARLVGRGQLDHRIDIHRPDELGELAESFNLMTEELQHSYERLQKEVHERRRAEGELAAYQDHLETLVEARTTELAQVNEDLQAATRAKDDFLAAMSHELRTPLNSIIGFTDIMLKGLAGEMSEEQKRQLGMVNVSGKQLLALVNDVLDLSRLEAGHIEVTSRSLCIPDVVQALMGMMSPLADEKGLTLAWHFGEGAPSVIESDRAKIDQILLNLLSNAVKFTQEGEVVLHVSAVGLDHVSFAVADTGIGVPIEHQEAIFDRFARLRDDRVAFQQGTGLGLSIARRLAEALGGTIEVASDGGSGSTFTLTVPTSARAPHDPTAEAFADV